MGGEGGGFQMEGFIFKWGRGVPWWELVLIGGGFKKNHRMGGSA